MRIWQLFGPSTSERPGSQTTCVRGRRPGQGAKERGPLEDAGRIWAALHQGLCLLRYPRRGRVRACDDGEEHWHEGDCRCEGAPQEPPAAGRFQERQACDHREGGACRSVRWPPAAPSRSPARFIHRASRLWVCCVVPGRCCRTCRTSSTRTSSACITPSRTTRTCTS